MKKCRFLCHTVLIFFLSISFLLSGCGGKPSNISDEHYQYGKKAIEIIDSYLDYEIDADEAYQQMKNLSARKETLPQTEFGDKTHSADFGVEVGVSNADFYLLELRYNPSNEHLQKLIEARNRIADEIGMKQR